MRSSASCSACCILVLVSAAGPAAGPASWSAPVASAPASRCLCFLLLRRSESKPSCLWDLCRRLWSLGRCSLSDVSCRRRSLRTGAGQLAATNVQVDKVQVSWGCGALAMAQDTAGLMLRAN